MAAYSRKRKRIGGGGKAPRKKFRAARKAPFKRRAFRVKRRGYGHRRIRFRRRAGGSGASGGGEVSSSNFKVFRKGFYDKMLKKMGGKRYLQFNSSARIETQKNQQIAALSSQTFDVAGNSGNYLLSSNDLGCCVAVSDADDPAAASQIYPNAGQTTRKVRLNWVKQTQTYRNQSGNATVLHLYDLVLRRDQQLGAINPITQWRDGLLVETEVVAAGAFTFADSGLGEKMPGSTPFQSVRFCQTWKVARVHKIELHPGAEHIHYVNLKCNWTFSPEIFTVVQAHHGRTYCTMAVVRGGVANDAINTALVGTGVGAIDVTLQTRYEVQGYYKSRTLYKSYTNLPTITAPQIIKEDTDVAGPMETA